jgi:two-component system sensor histidine kinase ChvG
LTSIRWTLIGLSVVLVGIPVYILNHYAIRSFDAFTSRALEEEMISHAFMVGEQYKAMVLGLGETGLGGMDRPFGAMLQRYGPAVQSRLQVLSPAGTVLFDSSTNTVPGADLSDQEEVRGAMRGGYDARWERTANGTYVFYYVALPVKDHLDVVGIVRVSRHTGPIIRAITRMIHDQRLAMLTALGVAVGMSAVLAQTMTRRLRRLTRGTRDYAEGRGPLSPAPSGRDEIGELGRAVTHMAGELERRSRYNRDFISTVMHELKTPLTAIKGAAEVLEQGAADAPKTRAKFLSNIRFEVDRMIRMVGELNALTKLDTELSRDKAETVDVTACVQGILERLEPSFESPHATVSFTPPAAPARVRAVPARLEQVFANLLDNALRYTPPTGRVDITVDGNPAGAVVIRVRDTGVGISPANLDKVFDRFFTTEPKHRRQEHGSGLGLAVVKSIIERHGGRIAAASVRGEGTTFTITLPAVNH